ncbi:MAG: GCN5-related N-acetyltransferase protein [Akkermansiaceae bacterium]|nr:GCN5-related N-acetyltransferase protein [Akkermansiaceae bacterium]
MEIRIANQDDLDWLVMEDDVTTDWASRCIRQNEYILATGDGNPLGFLRFSLFWGRFPYMDMIRVRPASRKNGFGTAMLKRWEEETRRQGHQLLMTSSQEDEPEPQAWHTRNGFSRSGQLTFGKQQAVPEIFFVKDL